MSWLAYAMLVFHITGNGKQPHATGRASLMLGIADLLFAHYPAQRSTASQTFRVVRPADASVDQNASRRSYDTVLSGVGGV